MKSRGDTYSKYIITGEKHRRCEFFTTGCASCRKKRPIDFPEASCGACAPRNVRKRGASVEFPCLRTLRHRHSQARRKWNRPRFPAAYAAGFTENAAPPLRVGLPYNIYRGLQTHFNNHYFTLTFTSSKYIVTGEKRRRREFFTTGCASCRNKRPIDFPEASCGACAPRSVRKRGNPREAPCFRTLRHRYSQARRSWNKPRLQVNINVYTPFRLAIKNRLEGDEHKPCIFRPENFLFRM